MGLRQFRVYRWGGAGFRASLQKVIDRKPTMV